MRVARHHKYDNFISEQGRSDADSDSTARRVVLGACSVGLGGAGVALPDGLADVVGHLSQCSYRVWQWPRWRLSASVSWSPL
jgi:hypothetical protein